MLHPTEYLVIALLKKEIANIANDSRLLADMFSAFRCIPEIAELVGDNFYTQLVDLIGGQGKDRLHIKLAHLVQPNENFGIYVLGSKDVQHKFLGDYGQTEALDLPSVPVGQISLINRKKNGIDFTIQGSVPCWLKPGMVIASGCKTAVIQRIYPLQNKTCIEFSEKIDIPTGEYLFFTPKSTEVVTKGVTSDMTSITVELATMGDVEVHMGMQMLVMYCLRRLWPKFDDYGFHEVGISQGQIGEMGASLGYSTTFSLRGKTTSTWIQHFDTQTQVPVNIDLTI